MTDHASPTPTLATRLTAHLWRKLVMVSVLPTVFMAGYAAAQRLTPFEPTVVPATPLDRLVAFDARWVWPYLSLYLYLPIAPWLSVHRRTLVRYRCGLGAISLIGLAVFVLFPTTAPRDHLADGPALNFLYNTLLLIDMPTNACPSLHAALTVFSLMFAWRVLDDPADRVLRRRVVLGGAVWAALIFLGIVGTKQHRAIDLFAGSALALVGHAVAWTLPWRSLDTTPTNPIDLQPMEPGS